VALRRLTTRRLSGAGVDAFGDGALWDRVGSITAVTSGSTLPPKTANAIEVSEICVISCK
jgi:hypothetical protein